ncbi:MAG: membrane-bound lytic murein transglycosylase MltF [Pseudomonadota bacterium]
MRHALVTVNSIFMLFIVLCVTLTAICARILTAPEPVVRTDSLTRIIQRGALRMITDTNANGYYLYKNQPMGFEYFMAREFANYIGVDLEVAVPGRPRIFDYLENNKGDFIATGFPIRESNRSSLTFAQPYALVQQCLVHHKLILEVNDISELAGRIIHVPKGSAFHECLEDIKRGGVDITIVAHEHKTVEELLRMVQDRKIKYTVADSNLAHINRRYYPDIVPGLPLTPEVPLAWAVRKDDTELLDAMNTFFQIASLKSLSDKIYAKYYGNIKSFDYFDLKTFHERIETRLPEFRDAIIKESTDFGFDWRLIAALVYQESHFDPWAESQTGVKGIMQITTDTANEMGIDDRINPMQSIQAGIRYLSKLYQRFLDIKDPHQRLIFTLAAYNIGYGHVRDAQMIAETIGLERNRWFSLKATLPLLTQGKYYKKARFGYARGREPVRYVERVLTYYDILRHKASFPAPAKTPEKSRG